MLEVNILARRVKLPPVRDPLKRVPVRLRVALVVDEASELLERLEGAVATADHGLVVVVVYALAPELVLTFGRVDYWSVSYNV